MVSEFNVRPVQGWALYRHDRRVIDLDGRPIIYETAEQARWVGEHWERAEMYPPPDKVKPLSDKVFIPEKRKRKP